MITYIIKLALHPYLHCLITLLSLVLDHFAENHGSYYGYVVLIDVHTDSSWILSYIYMGVVLLQDTIFNKSCIRSGTCKPINFTHTHTHTQFDCIYHFSLE